MKKTIEMGLFKDYPDVLSVKEVCQALQIGRVGVYKLLETKEIYSFKIGKIYKIPKDSLIVYINQKCGATRGGIKNDRKSANQK